MKPKLSRRLRSPHRYPKLLANETTHLHSLYSMVVRVCTRIRKGHCTASTRLHKEDTGHQVIRQAQRNQRAETAALNMSVRWFERLENPQAISNPALETQSRQETHLHLQTEEGPNFAARKGARDPSKSSLSRGDCLKKQRTGRPSTTGRSKSFENSPQEKCKEAQQIRKQTLQIQSEDT